ncbi:hypothetical protein H5159_01120 [Pseudoalteromonas sp. SG43-1]|uniref:hypothetical protein n=1 Tax=Pseudoalteromonas sp. SG43-1 TaxID=2760971 RepID=UPI001602A99F|nr:hypothetical protein [Pseudoalteromonas sp. SG43-1]MBB1449687.1 hypothetical protein [Pseudoalteromonas sp. SG43-1]
MPLLIVMFICLTMALCITGVAIVRGQNTTGIETALKHKIKHYMPEGTVAQQDDYGVAYSIVMDLGAAIEQPDNWDKIESISVGHKRVTNFRNQALKKPTNLPPAQERPIFKLVK